MAICIIVLGGLMQESFEINPSVILSKLDLKEDDTILITIDLDKYDLDEAYEIFKLVCKEFPKNNILTTFKGIDIEVKNE